MQCRAHDKGVTIQGAISAASAVATAACQAEDYPLPQTMLLQCPASVRKQACSTCFIASFPFTHSFMTRFPIWRLGTLQQTSYNIPPALSWNILHHDCH